MHAATQAWKFWNNKLPPSIAAFYERGNERQKLLKTTDFRFKRLQNISPISFSIRIWNLLPLEIKEAKTAKSMKKAFCNWKLATY